MKISKIYFFIFTFSFYCLNSFSMDICDNPKIDPKAIAASIHVAESFSDFYNPDFDLVILGDIGNERGVISFDLVEDNEPAFKEEGLLDPALFSRPGIEDVDNMEYSSNNCSITNIQGIELGFQAALSQVAYTCPFEGCNEKFFLKNDLDYHLMKHYLFLFSKIKNKLKDNLFYTDGYNLFCPLGCKSVFYNMNYLLERLFLVHKQYGR